MSSVTAARWILIAGIAFVFLYFGIEKFVHPDLWIGWMPGWIDGLAGQTDDTWMQIIAVTEIVIAIAVVVPIRVVQKAGALFGTIHLAGILTQVGWNDVAVRDVGLISMTMALWYLI